jgi:hypothetical protein
MTEVFGAVSGGGDAARSQPNSMPNDKNADREKNVMDVISHGSAPARPSISLPRCRTADRHLSMAALQAGLRPHCPNLAQPVIGCVDK